MITGSPEFNSHLHAKMDGLENKYKQDKMQEKLKWSKMGIEIQYQMYF